MSQKLRNYLNSENKFIFDFGLHINGKKIAIYKNYCSLPKPLVFTHFQLQYQLKQREFILLDLMDIKMMIHLLMRLIIIKKISKNYTKISIKTLTKSKYKIPSLIFK